MVTLEPAGPGSVGWTPDQTWTSIAGGVQGGMVAGTLLAAARASIGAADTAVRAATVHFLHRVDPGSAVDVRVSPDRAGSTASLRAELWQGDRAVAMGQLLVVPVSDGAPAVHAVPDSGEPVGVAADGEAFEGLASVVPFARHVEIRALGSQRPLGGGSDPRLTAWVRVRPDLVLDPLVQLALIADALPPSSFAVLTQLQALPTVELTLHLTGVLPGPGEWVRVDEHVRWALADVVVDDATLHDEAGRLLAVVRQTRRAFAPR